MSRNGPGNDLTSHGYPETLNGKPPLNDKHFRTKQNKSNQSTHPLPQISMIANNIAHAHCQTTTITSCRKRCQNFPERNLGISFCMLRKNETEIRRKYSGCVYEPGFQIRCAMCVCGFVSKRVPGLVARVCVFVSRNVPVSPRNAFAVLSRNVFPVCVCGFVLERVWCIRGFVLKRVSRLSFSSWKMFPN